MSGINFLSENLVEDATLTITTGAENAQFPLSNIKNDSTTYKFRSVGNTVVVEVDLLQTRDLDTIAVVGDATSTFEITDLIIKTSVTTDFSGSTPIPVPLSSTEGIGYAFFTSVNHRYVELTFTGSGSFTEVSNIFIGAKLNLPFNSISVDSFVYGNNDPSQIKRSDFGQRFINQFPFIKQINGTIQFSNLTETDQLDELYTRHGRHSPMWMIVDPDSEGMIDGTFKLAIYGYFDKMPKFRARGGQNYNSSIEVSQVV